MKKNPKVSILLPYYGDRYSQLEKSLLFLCNQTYKNYEIIFLNDGRQKTTDRDPTEMVTHSKIKHFHIRKGIVPIRSPNIAYRLGFYNCDGDFIITTHPEHLVPYDAVSRMVKWADFGRRNVATQHHLTPEQIYYLFGDGLKTGWKKDFRKIKDVPGFMATRTPWGYTNFDAHTYANSFSWSGSTRERYNKFLIPPTEEWGKEDCYVIDMEKELGEPSVPINIDVYHQEHDRVYGTITEASVRIQRIRESRLK